MTEITEKQRKQYYLPLFITFFKLSAFTFGGGYAMLPLLQEDIVEHKKWLEAGEMMDMVALSESTPGPFIINAATFVGYRVAGVPGAVFATLGVALPSYLVILAVSVLFAFFRDNRWVDAAFKGIRAGVVVLICKAALKLGKKLKWKAGFILLAAAAFCLSLFTEVNVIVIILTAGIIGLVYTVFRSKHPEKSEPGQKE